jgi:hypothetical protein
MATPVTDAFIRQIRGAATIMGGVQVDAVTDAAKRAKPIMEASVVSMVGPDMRLRNNVTKSGKPKGAIKVRYKIGQSDKWGAYARISASGPIALIEKGSPIHDIAPRRSRRNRKKPNTMLAADARYDHPYGGVISHPGFTGKGRWAHARDNVVPAAARAAFLGRNIVAFGKAFS